MFISIHKMALVCAMLVLFTAAHAAAAKKGDAPVILLSSTIGPIDAGIIGALEDAFEKETGIIVRHVGAGTGEALKIAEKGAVDLVLAHAKSLEEKFVADGFGKERIDLMYNDFVILGPASDPAGISGMSSVADALKRISEKKAPFITRGDKSGTHVAEMELWKAAGIKPEGPWYMTFEKGSQGNVPTVLFTNEKQAYTIMDRATYITQKEKLSLKVLVEKDAPMINYMSLIPVNPAKARKDNYKATMKFVNWLVSPKGGQAIIERFGVDKYGEPLFFPNSQAWKKAKK